jgi:Cytochrome P460
MRSSKQLGWLVVAVAASSGCSNETSDGAPQTEFTAYAQSFTGFHSWSNAPATTPGGASDGLHGLGPLQVYWNQSPPHGATSFPVGTIIVKETQEADPTQRTVFAMVKEGGVTNAAGAVGWQWFSLADKTDGTVSILWEGLAAPLGQTYANQAIGDCNGCHEQVADNDFVWDSALDLANF